MSGGSPSVMLVNSHGTLRRDGEGFKEYRNADPSPSMVNDNEISHDSTALFSPEKIRIALSDAIDSHGVNEFDVVEPSVRIGGILNDLGVCDPSAALPIAATPSTILGEGEVNDNAEMTKSHAAQGEYLSQELNLAPRRSSEGQLKMGPVQYHGSGPAFGVEAMDGIESINVFNNPLGIESENPGHNEGLSVTEAVDTFLSNMGATNYADPQYALRVADTCLSRNSSAGLHMLAAPNLLTPDKPPSNIQLSASPLIPDTGPVAELLDSAGRISIEVSLGTTSLGAFCSLASPAIGEMKISLSRPFKTRAEGEAAVCEIGLLVLKPMMPDYRPSHDQTSEGALAPAPYPPQVSPNTPICTARNMEAHWKNILGSK